MNVDNRLFEKRIMEKLNILAPQIRNQYVSKQKVCHKNAYLTIDDAPTKDSLLKLSVLQQRGIPAIWFCIGKEIEQYKDIVITIIKEGGIIGNHSYSHVDFSAVSLEKCFLEIYETDRIIDECYKEANISRKIKLFRFPFGNRGISNITNTLAINKNEIQRATAIQNYLNKLGYRYPDIPNINYEHYKNIISENSNDMYWTYDVMEWALIEKNRIGGISSIKDVIQLMDVNMPNKWLGLNSYESDEIVLIHDHVETTKYFEELIDSLLKKGISFQNIVKADD